MTLNMNGTTQHSLPRPFLPGVYAPLPTFFHPDTEELGKKKQTH